MFNSKEEYELLQAIVNYLDSLEDETKSSYLSEDIRKELMQRSFSLVRSINAAHDEMGEAILEQLN